MIIKKILPVLWCCVMSMIAQAQSESPAGTYYLEGVMETASGFKLNPDSTFEFFFSQGALDRTGKGTWKVIGSRVVLQSEGKKQPGFVLIRSDNSVKRKTVVAVREPNTMLLSFVYVRIGDNPGSEFLQLTNEGILESESVHTDKIQMLFELCPERVHEFIPVNPDDTYFEFNFHPSVFDVHFDNFELERADGDLEGPHPLLKGSVFRYVQN